MSVPSYTDVTNPPYNSLSRSSHTTHVIVGDISTPLYGTALQTDHSSPVPYMIDQLHTS